MGFFDNVVLDERRPIPIIARCGACGLHKTCESPKMEPTGEGKRGVLVVAEAPGKNEDEQGVQLVGKAGQKLRSVLDGIGVDLDEDCIKTNTLICRPPDNAKPTADQISACQPNLLDAMKKYKPKVVVMLGGPAITSLVGTEWKEAPLSTPVSSWAGHQIPSRRFNAWLCPTFHSSYLLREDDPALEKWFERHLRAAFALTERPYPDEVPDYKKDIRVVIKSSDAAAHIRKMIDRGGRVAFDFETTTLKPDSDASEIVTCSVCWEGKRTIAYPMDGDAVKATGELLRSDRIEKLGWNCKFEDRWAFRQFGHPVRGWVWDGMVGSHILRNQKGLVSLDFQAYVRYGQPLYNKHIKPYLEAAEDSNSPNRIKQIPLRQLLIYNGLDSLLTYKIGIQQMKEIGLC